MMGRRRSIHHGLPPRVNAKGARLYYVVAGKWTPLGSIHEPAIWLANYAKLHGTLLEGSVPSFDDAARHYLAHELASHAAKTQREYVRQIKKLCRAFGHMPLQAIEPQHVQAYMNKRSAKHAATREKALLSTVFNVARNAGLTTAPNPCIGVRGVKSHRDVYVQDRELMAVVNATKDRALRKFLMLAYRTGADASVVLALRRTDIAEGAVHVQRTKTKRKTAIGIEGPLKAILDEADPVPSMYLIADERGQPISLQVMRRRFWEARKAAGVTFQIRDLRAKAGTDVGDIEDARKLLGHASETTTAGYRRRKVGERARPVMKDIEK